MVNPDEESVYIVLKRKYIVTVLTVFITLFVGVIGSFQYSDYVDRRSNQRWCGLVGLFNETYTESPPTTETGRKIATEMLQIQKEFDCT